MSFTANIDEVVAENRNHLLGKHPKWGRVRLKEVATILNGYPFESARFKKSGGTPLIRIRDILPGRTETFYEGNFDPSFLVQYGEILVGMDGDFHCEPWTGEPGLLNQRVCKITPDESRYTKQFLRYVLPGYLSAINAQTPSVTVKHLSSRTIADMPLPLPPLAEQRRIVAEIEKQFTRLEAGVAALRRVQANLKRYRAAVLKAACEGRLVLTDAELAKIGNRKGKFETGEALLARILTERRKKWHGRGKYEEPAGPDTTALQKLPEGWTWATVEQLSTRVQYGSSAKTNEDSDGVPVLRMGNIQEGKFDFDKLKYLPKGHDEFPELLLAKGDLLFNRTNSAELVGKTAVFKDNPNPCSFASYLIRVRFGGGCISDFVSYYINSVFGRAWIADVVSQQVGQANVNGTKLQALTIPLPPLAEQTRIVAEVEWRLSLIEELEEVVSANLQRAARLRQSILQKAFTGELIAQEPAVMPAAIGEVTKQRSGKRPNAHFARALISAEIVHRLHSEPTFGRTKHQKIFYLCEHIAKINEIQGQYHREAAGPLDNKLIYANEAELKRQKWYQEIHRNSYGHAYEPLAKAGGHAKYVKAYWPEKMSLVERIIELMRTWTTDQCEMFCTTYAAWNDLVIWGKEPTDAAIVHEILERWNDSKKRFAEEHWRRVIGWMRNEGFVPTGFGKPTMQPE